MSFGFKYGEPYPQGDLIVDLRNRLANPQSHLPEGAIGTDAIVRKTVLGTEKNRKAFRNLLDRARRITKTKAKVSIAFGCTSGIHRSVVFAEAMGEELAKAGHTVEIEHIHLRQP